MVCWCRVVYLVKFNLPGRQRMGLQEGWPPCCLFGTFYRTVKETSSFGTLPTPWHTDIDILMWRRFLEFSWSFIQSECFVYKSEISKLVHHWLLFHEMTYESGNLLRHFCLGVFQFSSEIPQCLLRTDVIGRRYTRKLLFLYCVMHCTCARHQSCQNWRTPSPREKKRLCNQASVPSFGHFFVKMSKPQ